MHFVEMYFFYMAFSYKNGLAYY